VSQLEIQILHQDYLLTCPDGHEAQLMEAVERVDQQFQQMRDNSKLRSRERVGVLLAVNLAYENLELRNQLQALQQQLAALQNTSLRSEPETELDTLRLQHLESQAAHDLEAANRLLQRLDRVLDTETSSYELEKTTTEETDASPLNAQVFQVSSTAVASMDLGNSELVDLTQAAPKSL